MSWDATTLDELATLGSATLLEASKLPIDLPSSLRPVTTRRPVAGSALPVRALRGDNLPLHTALESATSGDVLVADAQDGDYGYWGEVLTVAAQVRGVRGIVINGGVRDIAAMTRRDFPVHATRVAIPGTGKSDRSSVQEHVALGHVQVCRGDLVVADDDGVVALPAGIVNDILAAARSRQETEEAYLQRIKDGESTLDIYGFRTPAEEGTPRHG